jgi:hypothetical protein
MWWKMQQQRRQVCVTNAANFLDARPSLFHGLGHKRGITLISFNKIFGSLASVSQTCGLLSDAGLSMLPACCPVLLQLPGLALALWST